MTLTTDVACNIGHEFQWSNLEIVSFSKWKYQMGFLLECSGLLAGLNARTVPTTHHPFKLESANLNHRSLIKSHIGFFMSVCGGGGWGWGGGGNWGSVFTLTFRVKFNFIGQNFRFHPRLLYGPDCFMVSILYTYFLDCFMVSEFPISTSWTYTDICSRGLFSI